LVSREGEGVEGQTRRRVPGRVALRRRLVARIRERRLLTQLIKRAPRVPRLRSRVDRLIIENSLSALESVLPPPLPSAGVVARS